MHLETWSTKEEEVAGSEDLLSSMGEGTETSVKADEATEAVKIVILAHDYPIDPVEARFWLLDYPL